MHALSVSLLAVLLLTLNGCGEKEAKFDPAGFVDPFDKKSAVTPEDFKKLQKQAESGSADAQYKLGMAYYEGTLPQTEIEKINRDEKSDDPLNPFNQFTSLSSPKKAVEWLNKSAVQGYIYAQFQLGHMFTEGHGVPKNIAKAVEWYQKAAEQGNTAAQYNLGLMYANGEDVPKDAVKAVEWFQKAAKQGDSGAQNYLGWMYELGHGVPKNTAKAVEWYQKAAVQGHSGAQSSLGRMYASGEDVPKDAAKAVEWLQKAAVQGDASAQNNIGWMYAQGGGVPKDSAKAVEWYEKAAVQGSTFAQSNLGWMYANGEGIKKNMVLAYAWSNLAAAQGDASDKRKRDYYESRLTPAQRAVGQRLASNWKKGDILLDSSSGSSGFASPDGMLSKQGTGTAFAVSSEGHALTNHHVIKGCTEVKVAGREGVAKVITSDSVNDLALLQLPGKTSDVASLNPDLGKLRQGEDIIVFGYPLNFVLSSGGNLTPGTISALTGLGNNTNQLQITAAIQPGSSGSPVMDKKANVVGVVSMKLDDVKMARATGSVGQSVNFAVNGQTVKSFLDANKVPYKTGGGIFSREKSNADIAEEASKWTLLVECWK